jgi:DnaJ-class molecular chaperone
MALLPIVEAAMKLGVSVELVEYFTQHCPKYKETRKLKAKQLDGQLFIDDKELFEFQRYLNLAWPLPPKSDRPGIPKKIKDDIKAESHMSCAICGHMDNGEVAHIEAVETSLNNSPDNLIYLCPNHHTKYDLGYRLKSNVTLEVVRAAKLLKRKSRQRMMAYEANAARSLVALIQLIKAIGVSLKDKKNNNHLQILTTEVEKLLELLPEVTKAAEEQARTDGPGLEIEDLVVKHAPEFAKIASRVAKPAAKKNIQNVVQAVTDKSHEVLLDFDEVDCPHCGGRGMTGIAGDFCAYCKGSCLITQAEADDYDASTIDECECPHCGGNGTIGLNQLLCKYCRGSCVVPAAEVELYDRKAIDETTCPHCHGRGTVGWNQNSCSFCSGDCVVSRDDKESYDPSSIDEVECPHCDGSGVRGFSQSVCGFCKGDSVMTKAEAKSYDPATLDEHECPHCGGGGTIGRNSKTCEWCGGDGFVDSESLAQYDESKVDETECPKCRGRGTYGLANDTCKLCKGDCVVTDELRKAFINKYGIED